MYSPQRFKYTNKCLYVHLMIFRLYYHMQHKADPKAMEKLVRHGWDACLLMREAVEQLDARRSEFVWHIFLHSHIQIESANALMMTYNHNTSVFCVVQEIVPTG